MNSIRHRERPAIVITIIAAIASVLLVWLAATPMTDIGAAPAAGTIYVDKYATGADNGDSWADAFTSLQDGLAVAVSGDEVWVAEGVYYPDDGSGQTDNDRSETFTLKSGVAVYGGFFGPGSDMGSRDWDAYVTVLSGDIEQDDKTGAHQLVEAPADITGDNSYHVVVGSGADSSARLDGFAITGGQANGSQVSNEHEGGGMFIAAGSPILNNLTFVGNVAEEGGAMTLAAGSAPAISNAWFTSNAATDLGGALHNESSDPSLTNVLFSGNRAVIGGGAIYNQASSPELTNVTISGNAAGGTVTLASVKPTALQVAASGGGIFNLTASKPKIQNSVIWNNQDDSGTGTPSTSIYNQDAGSTPTADNSDIQGLTGIAGLVYDGTSIDADPLFVAPIVPTSAPIFGGNYRLKGGSPAVDKGKDSFNSLPTDLGGRPRVQGLKIDMGAYESNPADNISIHKSSDTPTAKVGETINYSYEVINTGSVPLTGVIATDDLLGPIDLGVTGLAPGNSATGNLSYTVVSGDLPGPIKNTATVTATVGVITTVVATDTVRVSLSPSKSFTMFLPVIASNYSMPEPPETCQNITGNSSFEDLSAWVLEPTVYTAAYSKVQKHTGEQSVRTGIIDPNDDIFSYSSAMQTVTIPSDATKADLSYYLWPQSEEISLFEAPAPAQALIIDEQDALTRSDVQLVLILDTQNNELARLYGERRDDRDWIAKDDDLMGYKGETIKLYFGTFNNGVLNQGVTSMYVDDVELEVCTPN